VLASRVLRPKVEKGDRSAVLILAVVLVVVSLFVLFVLQVVTLLVHLLLLFAILFGVFHFVRR
jgi:hypothetical protein